MTGINFQPQVGDTSNGPEVHTYIPRSDGCVIIQGIVYYPQAATFVANAQAPPTPAATPVFSAPTGDNANWTVHPGLAPAAVPLPAAPAQPIVYQQPLMFQQPAYHVPLAQPAPTFQLNQPNKIHYGQTGNEVLKEQLARAKNLGMNKPQDMCPADPDPFRMYWVRELDNTYSQRNRLTIDSGDIGECRWYVQPDGAFYAVRLSSG